MADHRAARVSDDEYMTQAEFAALPSSVHHAVWAAHAAGRIGAVPASPRERNGVLRYNRAQVREIAAALQAAR